jgi:mono/diheme cytochrome c family protein
VAGIAAISALGAGAATFLLPGDAERGKELFHTQNCIVCHRLNGQGGTTGPDLERRLGRSYSPSRMTALMWNHAPSMWATMRQKGITQPQLSEQQAADLFAFLFSARSFEQPGDAGRGKQVFHSKRCAECHGLESTLESGAPPVAAWESLTDPIMLAQRMWNHSSGMLRAAASRKIPYPRLSHQELADLLVYLQSLSQTPGRPAQFGPAPAGAGAALFKSKGCAGCHHGKLAFEEHNTRYGLVEFAADMWNHAPEMGSRRPALTYPEMQRLVSYVTSIQFFEERGSPARGRKVFAKKNCTTCHDRGSLSSLAGRMSAFAMVEALWKHGPTMLARIQQQKISWPRFTGAEMADLMAFLNGPQLRRRRPAPRTP